MAARLNPEQDARTRAKIQTSQLVNRLQKIANGDADCSPTQLRAAEILLKKSLPDLSTVTITGDPENPVAISTIQRTIVDPPAGNQNT